MKTDYNETQQHILTVGYQLFAQKGFTKVGLSEILAAAGIPKGSFYHYFKSKEQFGEAVIHFYFQQYFQQLSLLFEQRSLNAYQQLMAYWQQWLDTQISDCSQSKCLVVKLSAEVADLSETMRIALLKGVQQVVEKITQAIDKAKADNLIDVQETSLLANTLYNLWLGASLQSKLQQHKQPLVEAMMATKRMLPLNSLESEKQR